MSLTGRLSALPSAGLAMGRAAPAAGPWPKVTSFPEHGAAGGRLRGPARAAHPAARPGPATGYLRDWQPPGVSPLRHFSYAIQWWSFAALTVFLWALLTFRKRRTRVNT